MLFKIEQVAPTDSTVLIMGETGTGKELVARAIHSESRRKDRPLVKVNCAALSASLIESELFGHEKGAFTGAAARKIGRFELADGATIFLDEIGELAAGITGQAAQSHTGRRVRATGQLQDHQGGCAHHRGDESELADGSAEGPFREDLFYRLNVFPITVPPLKQRREDIPLLVEHFARGSRRSWGERSPLSPRRR